MKKIIDLNTWERKDHYQFFMQLDIPQYSVQLNLAVKPLYDYVKKEKLSFYHTFMHTVLKVVNRQENFKYRIENDDVVYYDVIHASFTDRIENTKLFKYVFNLYQEDLKSFTNAGKDKSIRQGSQFLNEEEENRNDVIYFSTMPTLFFTAATQAMNINKKDAIPKMGWGQFREIDQKLVIPFNLVVNHAFVDGIHVEEFLADLQAEINRFNQVS